MAKNSGWEELQHRRMPRRRAGYRSGVPIDRLLFDPVPDNIILGSVIVLVGGSNSI